MELWIRSQNKKRLFKVEDIYTQKVGVEYLLFDQNKYCVGAYKNEERCLEIIYEIQDALCGNIQKYKGKGFVDKVCVEPIGKNVVAVINKEVIELPNVRTFVYEMPQE